MLSHVSLICGNRATKLYANYAQLFKALCIEEKATILINKKGENGLQVIEFGILLRDSRGKDYCIGHKNDRIDVAVFDITGYISENKQLKPNLKIGFIPEWRFATKDKIKEQFIAIGDRVLILGYPLNFVEGGHCIPIARDGIISTPPELDFQGLPIIFIDSTMIRGSSGGPVFLPILLYKQTSPTEYNTNEIFQPLLLGIVSELVPDWEIQINKISDYVNRRLESISVIDIANMGKIFKAETIKETIDYYEQVIN